MTDDKPRWLYRFDNCKRAFGLLCEAIEILETHEISQLERGNRSAFRIYMGIGVEGPAGFSRPSRCCARYGHPARDHSRGFCRWRHRAGRNMDARNRMSHTYNFRTFEKIVAGIRSEYLALFNQLHETLLEAAIKDG